MAAITGTVIAGAALASSVKNSADQKKAAKKAQGSADAANASAAEIAQQQQDISNEQWDNYKSNYLPLEQDYLESAKGYGSIANQEKAATTAAAATSGSFAGARDQLNKTPGLNPNSQQYLREVAKLGISEAATSAATQTAARKSTADTGAAMIKDAAALGKGMAGTAVSSLAGASASAAGLAQSSQTMANSAYNRAGASASGIGQMAGGLVQSGAFKNVGTAIGGLYDRFSGAPATGYMVPEPAAMYPAYSERP